ncbi:MAG: UxaA family hydrolase, partial [Candidatus Hodarchaeota archaeon]
NKIAVISSVVCVNHVTHQIANQVEEAVAITHPLGCGQFGPDFAYTQRTLVGLGNNPNVYGAIIIGLGCENMSNKSIAKNIEKKGKPVEYFNLQDIQGGSKAAIEKGVAIGKIMAENARELTREPFDFSNVVLGLECGASDSISGISANPVVGIVSDKIIKLGGTSILPEFTEWIGTEHLLAKRAKDEKVAEKIYSTLYGFIEDIKKYGIDFREIQPTPGNIEGGLTTIEEKSLGTISKAGKATIQGILEYSESPKENGLWLMIEPGIDVESMTGLAAAGANVIVMTTGRGTPCGNPIAPVIKICGNPKTCNWMASNIDINASKIITEGKSIEDIAEVLWEKLKSTCNGEKTFAEQLGFEDLAIWRCTAAPFQILHSKKRS